MARKMKDSGIEWIGEIPEEWEVHRVKNNFIIISGSGFKLEYQGNLEGDFPVCKASDISNAKHRLIYAANYISEYLVKLQGFSIIPNGSILFAKIGEAMKKNNRTICMVDCCVDNNCQGLVPNNIDSNFSYYIFSCIDMEWFDNAGTIPCVNNQKLYDCKIPYPNYIEQQRIADFLDQKCAQIDEILQKTRDTIAEYKKLKQSIITQAVTKGVRGERPMKDSGIEWIGEIPEEWEIRRIKTLGTYRNGLTFTPEDLVDKCNGTLVLRSSNIQNGKLHLEDNVYVASKIPLQMYVRKGDILICSRNGSRNLIGKNAIIDSNLEAAFGAFMMIFRCDYPKYMYYILNSSLFVYYLDTFLTSTINQLTGKNFGNMRIVYCNNIKEQQEIAQYLDEKCAEIGTLIEKKEQLVNELESYKKSLIYEYVTGKKEVIRNA